MLWSLFSFASFGVICVLFWVIYQTPRKRWQRDVKESFVYSAASFLFKYILHGGVAQPELIPPTLRCAVSGVKTNNSLLTRCFHLRKKGMVMW